MIYNPRGLGSFLQVWQSASTFPLTSKKPGAMAGR
jgi:hypothetical protein